MKRIFVRLAYEKQYKSLPKLHYDFVIAPIAFRILKRSSVLLRSMGES